MKTATIITTYEMLYGDYEQEMQRYDAYCYEYYCRLRQSNATLFQAMYENWYNTNHFYPVHYGRNRDLNFSSEFSNSERSSSLTAQSNEEWQQCNKYPTTTGMENDRPEINFHYCDSYFYGFYDAMRRVNPTMYAILYAKWCASHHLPFNDIYRSQIPRNSTPRKSSHLVRDQLRKDFSTAHCDTDESEILTSDSSTLPETKQLDDLERSLVEEYGQITSGRGYNENDRDITSKADKQLNEDVADGRVLQKFLEPVHMKSTQEIKQFELSERSLLEEYGQITSGSGHYGNDRDSTSEVDQQLNGGVADDRRLLKVHEPGDTKPRQEMKVFSSDLQSSSTAIDKSRNKTDELLVPEKKQGKSWINKLLSKMHFSSREAHLPDDTCPTIIWDSDRKQWVDTAKNENNCSSSLLLPPKSSGIAPYGAINVYRLKKSRDIRSKYVDVLQTSKQFSNVILGFNNSTKENLHL